MPRALDDELVMNLVELALNRAPGERGDFLRVACGDDTELFDQVRNYVQWSEQMRDFLLEPLCPQFRERQFEAGQLLLDRFRIVREIARGGMGIVYEAFDEKLGRRIALKCARAGFDKRLPPEVRHASEISHPNVCRTFEIHTAPTGNGETDFLTMEFLDGETLAKRLSRGPLPDAEARSIGRQICAGLAEAHRNRVVHGDLKSGNVILAVDANTGPRAVITDFGLARRRFGLTGDSGAAARKTGPARTGEGRTSAAGGTPDYMAPELWKGAKPSAASDVYALGVILYELVAGRRPQSDFPPRPTHHSWEPILQKCLDPDPARRFQNAGEVAAALEPPRSRRWFWASAAAAVVLAAVSGIVTDLRATAPKESVRLAMLPLQPDAGSRELADRLSREAAGEFSLLKGGTRARLSIVPGRAVTSRHVTTAEQAHAALGATHVVRGTVSRAGEGKILVHVFLTDARTQADSADWQYEYDAGEIHDAAMAIAGMVTSSLRLPPLTFPPVNAAARQDYLDGLKYTRRNSTIDAAIPLLTRAAAADPHSPLTWAGLAEAQYFKSFITKDSVWLDRATDSLHRAQSRGPDLAPVHRVAGVLQYKNDFFDRAEEEYKRALELDPRDGETYRQLGRVYDHNHPSQSLGAYKKATELDGSSVRAWQSLGYYYSVNGGYSEAVRQFEKCVQMAPDEASAHFALGTALKDWGRFPEAERELRRANELGENADARNNLAVLFTWEGNDVEAIPQFRRALELTPGQSLWLRNLGSAYRRTNRNRESVDAYRDALKIARREMTRDPQSGLLRARLAFLYAHTGEPGSAESELNRALIDSPGDTAVLGMAAEVYVALGEREKALGILAKLPGEVLLDLSHDPDLADLKNNSSFQDLLNQRGR